MSLQGPILIVAGTPGAGLAQAFCNAGAFPVIEVAWREAASAFAEINPAAVVVCDERGNEAAASALMREVGHASPFVPVVARLGEHEVCMPAALPIDKDAPVERLIARLSSALRVRALHATVLGRARALKAERGIVAELPAGDPIEDATVLLVGRGRHHATLSVAVGERMGVMGALSVEAGARCLAARDVDGIIVGEGLPTSSAQRFLAALAQDPRFRDMPIAVLGRGDDAALPNLLCARDPVVLFERALPLIRLHAFAAALKRLLRAIESKGMIDPATGLFTAESFSRELARSIEEASERGAALSLARFSFDLPLDRRASLDAARLVSGLVRGADFACRQGDGSILFAFADTDLRSAHVAARRLASVLKHTMLRPDPAPATMVPSVTLATLKPTDTALTLLTRVAPRPVAAA